MVTTDKYGNNPATIAKLLRAMARGTDTERELAVVFDVAANMLDPPETQQSADLTHRCIDFVHRVNNSLNPSPVDELVRFVNAEIARAYVSAAETFEVYGSDQVASKRFQSKQREKADCDTRAEIWNDAAAELRRAVSGEPAP